MMVTTMKMNEATNVCAIKNLTCSFLQVSFSECKVSYCALMMMINDNDVDMMIMCPTFSIRAI